SEERFAFINHVDRLAFGVEDCSYRARTVILLNVSRDADVLVTGLHEEGGGPAVFFRDFVDHVDEIVHLHRAKIKVRDLLARNGLSPFELWLSQFQRLGDQSSHGFADGIRGFHDPFVDQLERVRPDANLAAERMVHRRYDEDCEAKENRYGAAENQMDMHLHVEYREQKYSQERAENDHPPKDGRNAYVNPGEPSPPGFDKVI